jgi:hypothetical protein
LPASPASPASPTLPVVAPVTVTAPVVAESDTELARHVIETYTHKKFNRKRAVLSGVAPIGALQPFIRGPDYIIACEPGDDLDIGDSMIIRVRLDTQQEWTQLSAEIMNRLDAGELLEAFQTFARAAKP